VFTSSGTQMAFARAFHSANNIDSGQVLIAGGIGDVSAAGDGGVANSKGYSNSAEIYSAGVFEPPPSPAMTQARAFHTATNLVPNFTIPMGTGGNNGPAAVFFVAGYDGTEGLTAPEAYFPAASSSAAAIQPVGPVGSVSFAPQYARWHAAALLVNAGQSVEAGNAVLLTGGVVNGVASSTAELFFKATADLCASDGECLSGYCADQVCCDTACNNDCYACVASLKADGSPNGTCGPSVAGAPVPRVDCVSGSDGSETEVHYVCDGKGNAQPSSDTRSCLPSTCGNNNQCSTFCDNIGNGCAASSWCDFSAPPDAGASSSSAGSASSSSGAASADAGPGLDAAFLDGGSDEPGSAGGQGGGGAGVVVDAGAGQRGTCRQKFPLGTSCTDDVQCAPPPQAAGRGFCYDGFCCNEMCNGVCQACNVPGSLGTCLPLGASSPEPPRVDALHPRATCAGSPTSCEGLCTGDGLACNYPLGALPDGGVDPTKTLQAPECSDFDGGARLSKYPCDGTGSSYEVTNNCGGYKCIDAHTCRTTCTKDSECVADHICVLSDAGPPSCELLTGPLCDGEITLRRPIAQGGYTVCPNNYVCPVNATACKTSCESVTDCAPYFVCDDTRTCVSGLAEPSLPSCTAARVTERPGRGLGWVVALFALGGLASRRRRVAAS
jgi:hypothetical protein